MSDYRTAIDATTSTIDLRARYFRNQIVIVVSIAAAVFVAAAVLRRASALWAWLTIVPACGLYFFADAHALTRWRAPLLDAWVSGAIDFEVLRRSIRANPAIPKGTVEGMLQTLPEVDSLTAEQRLTAATRRAIAAATQARFAQRSDALLLKTVGAAIIVATFLAALWMRAWTPLTGLGLLAAIPMAAAARRGARERSVMAIVERCRTEEGFSESDNDAVGKATE